MWTRFMDMYSGGDQKLDWGCIYLEYPEDEAVEKFEELFGRNPNWTTCECCGEDYSVNESEDLAQATAYDRGCVFAAPEWTYEGKYFESEKDVPEGWKFNKSWNKYVPLEEYIKSDNVKVVYADHFYRG